MFQRIRPQSGDFRVMRAIVWFTCAGVLLYVATIFGFGWQETLAALRALGWKTLLIGACLSSSSYLWRFLRWEYALSCLGNSVPRLRHLGIYLSGLALTATPGKSGETFRSALLLQYGVGLANSFATFLADRASDVLGVCLLGGIAAWLVGQPLAWAWMLSFMVMLLGSCAFAYAVSRPHTSTFGKAINHFFQKLPFKGGQAIFERWAKVWTVSRVCLFSLVATLSYGTQALIFAWFCHKAGANLATADCVLIFVTATLFGAASMSPGGLGAMEAALVFQLTTRGVGHGAAVSLAIAIRLVTLWVGMAIGALALLPSSRKQALSHDRASQTE